MKKLSRPTSQILQKRPTKNLVSTNFNKERHAHLIRQHLQSDPFAMADVVKWYALSPSHIHKALLIFAQLDTRTRPIYNNLIRGMSQSEHPFDAVEMYVKQMYRCGVIGDTLTMIFLFKACGRIRDGLFGELFHAHCRKLGCDSDVSVLNGLMRMYGNLRDPDAARKVFDEMPERDLVSWNSLICGYAECKRFREVLAVFGLMRESNVKGDAVTMVKTILACVNLGEDHTADLMVKYIEEERVDIDVYLGNTMIDMYGQRGSPDLARGVFDRMRDKNAVSWNAMIKGYVKAGDLVSARKVLDDMPVKNVISWTNLITGYCKSEMFSDAVKAFQDMMRAEMKPDEITVASVLSACARLGSVDAGQAIHDYVRQHGIKEDVFVGNALIDMYCKCGDVEKAKDVFNGMNHKDSVSWTSIICGLAVNGRADDAIDLFSQMLTEGQRPIRGTFIGVLIACKHSGQVDRGLEFFESMEKVYRLKPEMKHYGCVVDLLSRSGNLERAYEFVESMPVVPDVVIWRILLGACMIHGNVGLAEIIMKKLLEVDPSNSGNYVYLSNAYAGSDRWEDADELRKLMGVRDVQKPSAWSSVEDGSVTSVK
ncbi:Pentatricopeptide repeat-containing protein At2g29760, chloroplastic [Linum grandiflorum]